MNEAEKLRMQDRIDHLFSNKEKFREDDKDMIVAIERSDFNHLTPLHFAYVNVLAEQLRKEHG